ncbi:MULTISPECIES: hypothetical protein [unclassified Streptomyces]|uniref:hypothetical protein n=1 Tax=unclassified Streptomyces TaxID=2593676 RepID=UPI00381A1C4A
MKRTADVTIVVANEADLSIMIAPPGPEAITTSVREYAKSIGAEWDEEAGAFYMNLGGPMSDDASGAARDSARSAARIVAQSFKRVGLNTHAYFLGRA